MINKNYILSEINKKINYEEAICLFIDNAIDAMTIAEKKEKDTKIEVSISTDGIVVEDSCRR